MVVEVEESQKCPACGTPLSRERWSAGLCPVCVFELALDDTGIEADLLLDPEEAPTLEFSAEGFSEGEIQGERYRTRSLLGRGGMGEVWRAYDLKLRQDVALKSLRTELIEDEAALEILRQEVRVAREVISPNVCRVFDLQEIDGQELISMEYVEGTTLHDFLRDHGPLELNEAREIAAQFLAGLEAIHAAGLVHRDIKPENLMITRTGRVVVMDFGIAKGLGEGKTGAIAGTPAYMSPEQRQGGELDARADLFSAGLVLAEMVEPEGIRTFEDRKRVWEHLHQESPQVADTAWSKVIAKAVAADREMRFAGASQLARALEEVTLRAAGDETARPYPGLSAFQQEDAEFFYGRELEVEALWKRLRRPHLLAVIGPSGAGKSSFLRAGLMPTLTDGWQAIIATPGDRPFANLARALAEQLPGDAATVDSLLRLEEPEVAIDLIRQWHQGHKHGLIILDQFEELFTQNPETVQEAFAGLLGRLPLEADFHVLLSMRDDFLMHCHRFEALKPVFSELSPLDPPLGAALRRALVEPALKCCYRFEDEGIVGEMLGEVEGQRGALPLIAFAAAQLWERRDRESGLLTRKVYKQIGGVVGALAQHAEAILDYIGEANVPIVRELFRNLVTAQGTRASRDRDELLSVFPESEGEPILEPSRVTPTPSPPPRRPAAKRVLNSLIDARLLTSYIIPADEEGGEPHHRIEVVHESLLSNWPRLVRWQMQDAEGVKLRDELRSQARLWDEHGRSEDYLWTGMAFKEYELWRERYRGGLTETEEAFARSMISFAARRRRRRRIAVTAVIAALVLGLTIVAGFWRQADRERERAEAGKLLALGEVEIDAYPTATLAWATKSLALADTPEGRLLALRALQMSPPVQVIAGDLMWNIAFSPNGQWLAVADNSKVGLRRFDAAESIRLSEYPSLGAPLGLAFASDHELVVDRGGDFHWYSVPDGRLLRRVEGNRGRLSWPREHGYFSFSHAQGQGSIHWWPFDEGSSRLIGSIQGWQAAEVDVTRSVSPEWLSEWSAIDIDPSGAWLAYSREKTAYLRRFDNWNQPPVRLGAHEHNVVEVALDSGGKRVATRDEAGAVRVWSTEGGSAKLYRSFLAEGSTGIRLDTSGQWLAAHGMVGGVATVRLWDLAAPQGAEPLTLARTDGTFAMALIFHPDEPWLVTSNHLNAGFWPLAERYPWVLRVHTGRVDDVAFTPDGEWLISAAGNGVLGWPLSGQNDGKPRVVLDRPLVQFPSLKFHPSGELFAVGSREGNVLIAPLEGGTVRELVGDWEFVGGTLLIDFSPDGRHLAAIPSWGAEGERVIRVWNLESGDVRTLDPDMGANPGSNSLYFDDDRTLRWVGEYHTEEGVEFGDRVFDLVDGSIEKTVTIQGFEGQVSRVVSHDGSFLLAMKFETWGVFELVRHSLDTGVSQAITSHGNASPIAIDPSDQWMVTGDGEGLIRVGPVTGEEPHLLFGHKGVVRSVAVSPDGRWIASGAFDGTIRLWPVPDISQPPLHTLPHDQLIAQLQELTNVRVVEDPESSSGWRIDYAPFPGWKETPEW